MVWQLSKYQRGPHCANLMTLGLEDRLKGRGGIYSKGADWAPYVQVDGKLVTGQNPASSRPGAEALLQLLHSEGVR